MAWRWRPRSDVGVDAGGDADLGVAEEFLDHDEFDFLLQEQGRRRVPEIVEADAAETGPVKAPRWRGSRAARPPARRAPGRRRTSGGESPGAQTGGGGGRFHALYSPHRVGVHVGQGQGATRANSGQGQACPSCRASVRPPDHARPQPGQDTGQSPLRRPHARVRVVAYRRVPVDCLRRGIESSKISTAAW